MMNRLIRLYSAAVLAFGLLSSCQKDEPNLPDLDLAPYPLVLPAQFPAYEIPADNALTRARVELGRRLFYETVLSANFAVSCASCHRPELAFAHNLPISPGVEGRRGLRNAPTLANVAYALPLHKDGGVPKLDIQAITPLEDFHEMDLPVEQAAQRLNADPAYLAAFLQAYGQPANAFTLTRALGAFQRILISGDADYDRFVQGDATAISSAAQRGALLFFDSQRTSCASCHGGFNFTFNEMANNGLYLNYADPGRERVTLNPADVGKFRTPTLRNVAVTAPYMHDGSVGSLAEVIDHYNAGGQPHPNRDPRIRPLNLSAEERADLLAFLESLTDHRFLYNPDFLQP